MGIAIFSTNIVTIGLRIGGISDGKRYGSCTLFLTNPEKAGRGLGSQSAFSWYAADMLFFIATSVCSCNGGQLKCLNLFRT